MTPKTYVTPGALTSRQAKAGIVVAVLFLLFGLAFGFVVLKETPDSETGQKLLMGAFFLIWAVACIAIIVMSARLLAKQKNLQENSLLNLYVEEPRDTAAEQNPDFETRLRKLEKIKRHGLISAEEYRVKRAQILSEKW